MAPQREMRRPPWRRCECGYPHRSRRSSLTSHDHNVSGHLDDVLSLEGSALEAKHYGDDCADNQPADAHDLRQLARTEQRVAQDGDADERRDPVHEYLLALLTKAEID